MSNQAQVVYTNFAAGSVATPNATEGVICTSRAVASPFSGSSFSVEFGGVFTAGAGTTSVTFRIRQGSLTGTAILTAAGVLIAAAQVFVVSFGTVDGTLADVAGQVWVLTAIQAAGAGAGGLINGYSKVTAGV